MNEDMSPRCLALVICDQVIEDKRTNKKSLIGTFNDIMALKAPVRYPVMTVFLSVTDCLGEHDVFIEIYRDNDTGGERVLRIPGKLNGRSPLDVIDMVFELRGVPLPDYGSYTLEAHIEPGGRRVGQRRFYVRPAPPQAQPPQAPPETDGGERSRKPASASLRRGEQEAGSRKPCVGWGLPHHPTIDSVHHVHSVHPVHNAPHHQTGEPCRLHLSRGRACPLRPDLARLPGTGRTGHGTVALLRPRSHRSDHAVSALVRPRRRLLRLAPRARALGTVGRAVSRPFPRSGVGAPVGRRDDSRRRGHVPHSGLRRPDVRVLRPARHAAQRVLPDIRVRCDTVREAQ